MAKNKKKETGDTLRPPHRYTPSYFFSKYLYPMVLKLFGEESMSYTAGLSGV